MVSRRNLNLVCILRGKNQKKNTFNIIGKTVNKNNENPEIFKITIIAVWFFDCKSKIKIY